MLFTLELNRRLSAAGVGVQALALHPGNVLTDVVRSLPPAIQQAYRAIMGHVLLTPEEGVYSLRDVPSSHSMPGRVTKKCVQHAIALTKLNGCALVHRTATCTLKDLDDNRGATFCHLADA